MKNLLLPLGLFLFSFQSLALVDYSDPPSESSKNSKVSTRVPMNKMENTQGGKSDFSLSTNYEMSEINTEKVGAIHLDMHLQTPVNVFMDASYWQADYLGKSQSGNPKFMLGFNWLKIGNSSDEARLDLMAGMKLPGQSDLASSRTDKIFGIETTKRFMNFGLGLSYELTLTSDPKKDEEVGIGNIQRIAVSAGWMVSNDIQFELEVENFKINSSSSDSRLNRLTNDAAFSTISPKLNLGLSPFINFMLGARFQMQKAAINSKVFDLHGANSSSIFTGLSLNL